MHACCRASLPSCMLIVCVQLFSVHASVVGCVWMAELGRCGLLHACGDVSRSSHFVLCCPHYPLSLVHAFLMSVS